MACIITVTIAVANSGGLREHVLSSRIMVEPGVADTTAIAGLNKTGSEYLARILASLVSHLTQYGGGIPQPENEIIFDPSGNR